MKNLPLSVILLSMLLCSTGAYAMQEDIEVVSFSSVIQFFLPAILGSLSVLFADAKKWMGSGEWSWKVFWKTKVGPFLLSLGVSVVIYFSITFLPWTQNVFEALAGVNLLEFTAYSIMGMATAILNGVLKPLKREPNAP